MNYDKRLLSIDEASEYIGKGCKFTRAFCDEIKATRRMGNRVLFDKKVIDARLDELEDKGS